MFMWWNQLHAAQYGSVSNKHASAATCTSCCTSRCTAIHTVKRFSPRMPVRLVQRLHPVQMVPIYFTEIVLAFVRFLCRNFSFYFVLVFWITIILVLLLWKRRPIILVLVLIFVTKITLLTTTLNLPRWPRWLSQCTPPNQNGLLEDLGSIPGPAGRFCFRIPGEDASRLIYLARKEGSTVSSIICDRWLI